MKGYVGLYLTNPHKITLSYCPHLVIPPRYEPKDPHKTERLPRFIDFRDLLIIDGQMTDHGTRNLLIL